MFGAVLRSGQKPEIEQRRHLKIGGLKRVSLLRFFASFLFAFEKK